MPDFLALVRAATPPRRPTGSRTWPTTPPPCSTELGIAKAHVVGRLHGRHDHPGPGHRPPRPLPLRLLHHVDHGRPLGGGAHRGGAHGAAATVATQPGGGHRGQPGGQQGHRLARSTRRTRASCASGPAPPTTAATAPRARRASWRAILASPDRTEGLHGVRLPFLVIHGEDDPLVTLSGGQATAAAVPGVKLITIPGHGPRPARAALGHRHRRHRRQHGARRGLSVGLRRPRALAAATEASQAALGLGVRAKVARSTATIPKRGR